MNRIVDFLLCLAPFGVGAGVAKTYGLFEGIVSAVVLSAFVFWTFLSRAPEGENWYD